MSPNFSKCTVTERSETANVKAAKELLRREIADPQELFDLAELLKKESRFGFARRLYKRARQYPAKDLARQKKLCQRHALCTYKDPDLPAEDRLKRALEILAEGEELEKTTDQETLGQAGAIYKRRWELEGKKENLERSLAYYRRGYRLGSDKDQGWNGINAAYVLDLLASLEENEAARAGARSEIALGRRAEARTIRQDLIEKLAPLFENADNSWLKDEWWFYATLAEAFFGLERYDEAEQWIKRGMTHRVPDWEYRSTATQLAALERLRSAEGITSESFEASPAARVLRVLLREHTAGVRTAYLGKVGLALSGGGFRASFFHIGVLAKLAELDVLRYVEVLSCVSGGSIIGTHYYLEIKRLLENKMDAAITREDYVELVKRLEINFFTGVQKNIRVRIAANLLSNIKMIFIPGYSRTIRGGELYERWLYSSVQDGRGKKPRWLTDLYVIPKGEESTFKPKNDNWKRHAKVPDLILNATTLNTGHNWQFTASWMGEPPACINTDIDGNYRLRRMYYWEAPKQHRCVRLGCAVAASACVPGLFDPVEFKNLYPGLTVRLVDGGVHDNQGIAGLLEQDCKVTLISDASGQMGTVKQPSSGILGVPFRSNIILMSRVRSEQYDEINTRYRSGLLRGFMYIHLKKGLAEDPVNWTGCQDPDDAWDEVRQALPNEVITRYGLFKDVQRRLSDIRTDLDSFSEAEAFALMVSGYRMTEESFRKEEPLKVLPRYEGQPENWRFLQIEPAMKGGAQSIRLQKLLKAGAKRAFKVWNLLKPLKALAVVLGTAAVAIVGWQIVRNWSKPVLDVSIVVKVGLAALVATVLGKFLLHTVKFPFSLQKTGIGIALCIVGWPLALLHLLVFDRLFLFIGKVRRVV